MTEKRRRQTIDLGSLGVGGTSKEIDASSFTHALIFVEFASTDGDMKLSVDATPVEFGETPDWYPVWSPLHFTTGFHPGPDVILIPGREVNSGAYNYRNQVSPLLFVYDGGSSFGTEVSPTSCHPVPRRIRVTNAGSVGADSARIQLYRSVG